jgi:hypothetical protein
MLFDLAVVIMMFGWVAAYPIWRSGPRPREIVTGIVEAVVTKAPAIAFVSWASAVLGAMRGSSGKVVRVESAVTAIGVRILAGREHVSRLLGFLSFIVHRNVLPIDCGVTPSELLERWAFIAVAISQRWTSHRVTRKVRSSHSSHQASGGRFFLHLPFEGSTAKKRGRALPAAR